MRAWALLVHVVQSEAASDVKFNQMLSMSLFFFFFSLTVVAGRLFCLIFVSSFNSVLYLLCKTIPFYHGEVQRLDKKDTTVRCMHAHTYVRTRARTRTHAVTHIQYDFPKINLYLWQSQHLDPSMTKICTTKPKRHTYTWKNGPEKSRWNGNKNEWKIF